MPHDDHTGNRAAASPHPGRVGIFWGVPNAAGTMQLVIDSTPLSEAEPYGDFLTHPGGHYEVWETWRRLGPAKLAARGLPPAIVWNEYEEFPRGRVVFDTRSRRFTLYADRKLQEPRLREKLLKSFGLDATTCDVRSDPHYRTSPGGFKPALLKR